MHVRPGTPADLLALRHLIDSIENFTPDEKEVARELAELAVSASPGERADYELLVAEEAGALAGYVCFGPTPMTLATWDLYWIVSSPRLRGRGAGSRLLLAMEEAARRRGGRQVRIETSSGGEYVSTRAFYDRHGYPEVARLRDFYKPGDDLITLYKRL
ncbi:MAG TPA: GNAT family N-acetyltransferase [Vulgatibacter sp.]|nr:GNAT family N-acetyltransferase [Vulgatibacter sp.]